MKWTTESANAFVNKISKAGQQHGLRFEIVGGVKKRGFSDNDLDLAVVGFGTGDVDGFLEMLEHRFNISHEAFTTPGGPMARLFIDDDHEVDLFQATEAVK